MNDDEAFTVRLKEIASMAQVPDATMRRMELDTWRDQMLRSTVYSFRSYVATARQWEEVAEIPRKLTWRERIRCLFGGEIVTQLRYEANHNCPHIDTQPQRDHVSFLMPFRKDSA